jgi:hypothetical protein
MTASRSSHLTIRNVPSRISAALRNEAKRRGQSLNKTAVDLLGAATDVRQAEPVLNGLEKLAGTWTREEFDAFESALADVSRVDPEMWR